jgi:hypothetical protein
MALPSRARKLAHLCGVLVLLPEPGEAVEGRRRRRVQELTLRGIHGLAGRSCLCTPRPADPIRPGRVTAERDDVFPRLSLRLRGGKPRSCPSSDHGRRPGQILGHTARATLYKRRPLTPPRPLIRLPAIRISLQIGVTEFANPTGGSCLRSGSSAPRATGSIPGSPRLCARQMQPEPPPSPARAP